ncbi:DUF2789 domain-containing protein [Microbulbifer halophilus]|uniref:DUF2789 domain-containing protein n=1 Tax=Microbulbifer halophilus TaxID=453963 RepID=A0ABW5EAF8_9GAMM|nr:DUF2789 domain-containing protein [Microbulbifer halophilus]MCW8125030.1 DUF2789 domain-containing protein [Microbulbifer halophilus]
MEITGFHSLNDLFAQLGLDADDAAIEAFLEHHHLSGQQHLSEAPFWSEGQRRFLEEAFLNDSDWCEAVDELDTLLRH